MIQPPTRKEYLLRAPGRWKEMLFFTRTWWVVVNEKFLEILSLLCIKQEETQCCCYCCYCCCCYCAVCCCRSEVEALLLLTERRYMIYYGKEFGGSTQVQVELDSFFNTITTTSPLLDILSRMLLFERLLCRCCCLLLLLDLSVLSSNLFIIILSFWSCCFPLKQHY